MTEEVSTNQYIDELTGAYTRKYLQSFVEHELKRIKRYGGKFSLLFIDLDNFKSVNDLYGHLEGDRILLSFVSKTKTTLRESDIITRYGGDEFVIILPQTGLEDAKIVAERLIKLITEEIKTISCSIGIVEAPTHGIEYEILISKADKALYRAKRMGKARYYIYSEDIVYPQIPAKIFVDRHEEQFEILKLTKERQPLILVKGATGIGKTKLVKNAITSLEAFESLETRCLGSLSSVSFVPFKELFKRIRERHGLALIEYLQKLDEYSRSSIMPIALDKIPEKTESVDRYKFYETYLDLLLTLSKSKPLLIFIDDIQWIDKASLELLYYILRNSQGKIKFIATCRTEELPESPLDSILPNLLREGLVAEINIGPLSESATFELIDSILQAPSDQNLKRLIYTKTGGNPLFVEELIRELYEKDLIRFTEDRWILTSEDFSWVPQNIELVLKNKLKQFLQDPVLEVSAVIGYEFNLKVLKEVTGLNLGQIYDTIDKLLKNNIIEEKGLDIFAFKEGLLRDTVLGEISDAKKRYYSELILNAIEKLLDTSEGKEELCAYHAKMAGNIEKLKLYSKLAAEKLKKIYAYDEAIKFYRWYLEVEEDRKAKEEAFLSYVELLAIKGELKKALNETLDFIQKGFESAKVYLKLGELYVESGDTKTALNYIEKSLSMEYSAEGIVLKSWVLRRLNRVKESIELLESLIKSENVPELTLSNAYNVLGLNYSDLNEVEKALELFQKSEELRKKLNLLRGVGTVCLNRAILFERIDEYEKALQEYEKAYELYSKVGYKPGLMTILNNKASMYLDLKKYREAMYNYKKVIQEAEKIFDRHLMVLALNNLGVTLKVMEEYEEALEALDRAYQIGSELEMKDALISVRRNKALALALGFKDLEKAIPLIEGVLQDLGPVGPTYPSLIAHLQAVEIYLMAKDYKKAEELLNAILLPMESYSYRELKIDFYAKFAFLNLYFGKVEEFRWAIKKAQEILKSAPKREYLNLTFVEALADMLTFIGQPEKGLKLLNYLNKKAQTLELTDESERLTKKIKRVEKQFLQ